MLTAIVLALLAARPTPQPHCDTGLIWGALRQVEIADYEPSATPPPPARTAALYALAANKIAECADAPLHFMSSPVTDLLQAASFAAMSGQAAFAAHMPSQACITLNNADAYYRRAYGAGASSNFDRLMLRSDKGHVASLRHLVATKCQR